MLRYSSRLRQPRLSVVHTIAICQSTRSNRSSVLLPSPFSSSHATRARLPVRRALSQLACLSFLSHQEPGDQGRQQLRALGTASSFCSSIPPESTATSTIMTTCLLCDCECSSWLEHCTKPSHLARVAICHTFAMPERGEFISAQLQKHIRLDLGVVDKLSERKEKRRRGRLSSTIAHLTEEGIINESIPCVAPLATTEGAQEESPPPPLSSSGAGALCVGEQFLNLVLAGEGVARQEVLDRLARLMPLCGAEELSAVCMFVLSTRNVARVFDLLEMSTLVKKNSTQTLESGSLEAEAPSASPLLALRMNEKATVVFACLGELAVFHRQDRSPAIVSAAVADVWVQHVLATHALENILAELVHDVLQRTVAENTPVWREYKAQLGDREAETEEVESSGSGTNVASRSPPLHRVRQPPLRSSSSSLAGEKGRQVLPDTACRQLMGFNPLHVPNGSEGASGETVPSLPQEGTMPCYKGPSWERVRGALSLEEVGAVEKLPY